MRCGGQREKVMVALACCSHEGGKKRFREEDESLWRLTSDFYLFRFY